jgi:hypothetical protein
MQTLAILCCSFSNDPNVSVGSVFTFLVISFGELDYLEKHMDNQFADILFLVAAIIVFLALVEFIYFRKNTFCDFRYNKLAALNKLAII